MVVCKDDAGSRKREIVRRNFRSQVVGSKPIPYEDDDASCSRASLMLLRSEICRHFEQHEGENAQKYKKPYFHASPPG
jgi:hypothetical protein